MAVSGVCFPILNFCTDSCVVVKMHREGEHLDTGEGSEDSDCEGISEQPNGSAQEVQDDKKGEPESLPILIVGSFARCAHRRWQTHMPFKVPKKDFHSRGEITSRETHRFARNPQPRTEPTNRLARNLEFTSRIWFYRTCGGR